MQLPSHMSLSLKMVYQGSKNKLAKNLVPIIQNYINQTKTDTYIELFVGGANIIDKIECINKLGFDYNSDLICLFKYAQNDNDLSIAPQDCSFEHYKEVREDKKHKRYSQEYRALIGYMASYGGRYFDGGYARYSKGNRNIYKERLKNFKLQIPSLNSIIFECLDYKDFDISKYENAVFYLDPPYKGTKVYSKQSIDYDFFYKFCKELSIKNTVLISEYEMPEEFTCIWKKERKVLQRSDRKTGDLTEEKLYIFEGKIDV